MRSHATKHHGFTIVELLVVIVIILIVSVLALPTVLSGSIASAGERGGPDPPGDAGGGRDAAIRNNTPSGIRLLPDPMFNGISSSTGRLDSGSILAANRVIPIGPAPAYTEGLVKIDYVPTRPVAPVPRGRRRYTTRSTCSGCGSRSRGMLL